MHRLDVKSVIYFQSTNIANALLLEEQYWPNDAKDDK
jgi:hypothetical protein